MLTSGIYYNPPKRQKRRKGGGRKRKRNGGLYPTTGKWRGERSDEGLLNLPREHSVSVPLMRDGYKR